MLDRRNRSQFAGRLIGGIAALVLACSGAAAADAALTTKAPPLEAAPPTASAYVELYGGWTKLDLSMQLCLDGGPCENFLENGRGFIMGGAARANYWFGRNFSAQADLQAERNHYRWTEVPVVASYATTEYAALMGGHLNLRDPARGLIGAFGAGGVAGFLEPTSRNRRHIIGGGEAQAYLGNVTLYAQGGYDKFDGHADQLVAGMDAWFARGTARWFLTPNLLLEGTGLYAKGKVRYRPEWEIVDDDLETWLWQAKVEWKMPRHPFALFARYEGNRTHYSYVDGPLRGDATWTNHRVVGGLRLYFGTETLLANDRKGVTLDIISPLALPTGPLLSIGDTPPLID